MYLHIYAVGTSWQILVCHCISWVLWFSQTAVRWLCILVYTGWTLFNWYNVSISKKEYHIQWWCCHETALVCFKGQDSLSSFSVWLLWWVLSASVSVNDLWNCMIFEIFVNLKCSQCFLCYWISASYLMLCFNWVFADWSCGLHVVLLLYSFFSHTVDGFCIQ